MKKKYTLKIDNPCSEQWNAMDSTDQGKFCRRCEKNLLDVTNYSDSELIGILKNSDVTICGRANKNQVNKVMLDHSNKQFSFGSKYLILPTLLTFAFAQTEANYNSPLIPNDFSYYSGFNGMVREYTVSLDTITIRGIVRDAETTEVLPFANVIVNELFGTTTDMEGRFELKVPNKSNSNEFEIEVTYVGYEKAIRKIELDVRNSNMLMEFNLDIDLNYSGEEFFMLGIMILEEEKPSQKNRLWPFGRKKDECESD